MKIAVCIKDVPSSEAKIKIAEDGKTIETEGLKMVLNPYDEYAVEEALQIKEDKGGETVALTVGPASAENSLRVCFKQGIDRGLIVKDPSVLGGDAFGVAKILAAVLKTIEPDIILLGKLSIDEENSTVGPALAEYLGIPHVSVVSEIEWVDEKNIKAHREIEGAKEVLDVKLPAVLTANKGLNKPEKRLVHVRVKMAAMKKAIEEVDVGGLGLDPAEVGAAGRKTSLVKLEPPPPRSEPQKFEGDPKDVVPKVVKLLQEEAKVI